MVIVLKVTLLPASTEFVNFEEHALEISSDDQLTVRERYVSDAVLRLHRMNFGVEPDGVVEPSESNLHGHVA